MSKGPETRLDEYNVDELTSTTSHCFALIDSSLREAVNLGTCETAHMLSDTAYVRQSLRQQRQSRGEFSNDFLKNHHSELRG